MNFSSVIFIFFLFSIDALSADETASVMEQIVATEMVDTGNSTQIKESNGKTKVNLMNLCSNVW